MKIKLPHNTTQALAIDRAKKLIDDSRSQFAQHASDIKEEWDGNVLNFGFSGQGQKIEGTLTVTDTDFEVYAKLPLALRLFEGTIERMIHAEAKKLKI